MIGSLRVKGKLFIERENFLKLSKIFPNIVTENAKISPRDKNVLPNQLLPKTITQTVMRIFVKL